MNKKVAIVTGGSNGIGKSTALELATRGIGVILTYNSDKKGADALVLEIEQQSAGRAAAMKLDLSQKSSVKDFAHLAKNALGEIWQRKTFDYLVNNGGIGGGMMFTEVTEDYFNRKFDTNFKGPYFLHKNWSPSWKMVGIVNNASTSSRIAPPGYSAYGPSKAALSSWTRYLEKNSRHDRYA